MLQHAPEIPFYGRWISYFDGRLLSPVHRGWKCGRSLEVPPLRAYTFYLHSWHDSLSFHSKQHKRSYSERERAAEVKPRTRSIDIKKGRYCPILTVNIPKTAIFIAPARLSLFAWSLLIFIGGGMQLYSPAHTRSIKRSGPPECHFSSKHTLTSLLGWISWRGRYKLGSGSLKPCWYCKIFILQAQVRRSEWVNMKISQQSPACVLLEMKTASPFKLVDSALAAKACKS